jgi:hypothetical protein
MATAAKKRKGKKAYAQEFPLRPLLFKDAADEDKADKRLILLVSTAELQAIREYQQHHQIRDRSEALRRILHKAVPEIREKI